MSQVTLVSKPASGHWTDAYPEFGRGPVSLEDCVSEEFYDKEREHVFKKTWLYVGRVERVPRSGSYFTRELQFLNTSIIVVRGKDDVIRAFHNICPHRGNKMLWQRRPVRGSAGPRAAAVLPLPRLALQPGRLAAFAHPRGPVARLRRRQLPRAGDSMRSVGRLHLHQPQPRQHRVGALLPRRARAAASRAIPSTGRTRCIEFKAELQCNWKIFVDGFAESYHGPYLHASSFGNLTAEAKEALDKPNPFTDALAYQLKGPHRMFSFAGEPSRKTPYSKPIECVMEASAAGPWNKRPIAVPCRRESIPSRAEKYGFDSFQFFPNFVLIFGASGFTVHTHWPTGPHSHIFETEMYYQPPKTHKERLGQELTVTFLNDIILEDASPSEGLQAMLNSGALTHFTMNDEEILLRHLHKVVGDYVEAGEKAKSACDERTALPPEFS